MKVEIKNAYSSDATFEKCFKLFLLLHFMISQFVLKNIILLFILFFFILLFALPISIKHFVS